MADLNSIQAQMKQLKGNDQPEAKLSPQGVVASVGGDKTGDTKVEKLKKVRKSVKQNGGARAGSGRKKHEITIVNKGLKEWMDEHANEPIEMTLIDKKTGKTVTIKKPRRVAVIEKLFEIGMKGDKVIGNVAALKEWLDRYAGKAAQPIRGEGEDSPIRLHVDNLDRILEKAYGNEE